jgi:hypothetical protein
MRVGRAVLDSVFVVGFFFAFLFGGLLFDSFYESSFGVNPSSFTLSISIEFVISFVVATAALLYSWKRHGKSKWHNLILGSTCLLVFDVFEILAGGSFPIFFIGYLNGIVLPAIFLLCITGVIYGTRGILNDNNKKTLESAHTPPTLAASTPSLFPKNQKRILIWSAVIAVMGGIFGLVALDYWPFGMFMEVPPPFLGQPIPYQSLVYCNQAVCPPLVVTNYVIAAIDYFLCFVLTFVVAFSIQKALVIVPSHSQGVIKRNIVPVVLIVITLLATSSAAWLSFSSGASFTEPHWSTPSGMTFNLDNITLFSGPATTPSSEGAHFDMSLVNYHWTDQYLIVSFVNLKALPNGAVIYPAVYQCQSPSSCEQNSTVDLAPYSIRNISFYLGSPVQRGVEYSYNFSIVSQLGTSIMSFDNITAS